MRILVSGAGGFVGRALVRLLAREHHVVALDQSLGDMEATEAIEGDLADPAIVSQALEQGCDAVVHLATVPGGAAELDPQLGWHVNMDGTAALVEAFVRTGRGKRFVFASSIAVFGDELPDPVADDTPLRPKLLYGAHKAMAEQWLATRSRRGDIDAISLRLSGILARPKAPSGMKSAFMSDVFHAALAGDRFICPVSAGATMWMMSIEAIARNLRHALKLEGPVGEPHAVTLPAVHATMGDLVAEIALQTGRQPDYVSYEPEEALEAGFGRFPRLDPARAVELGFEPDDSLGALVGAALNNISR